MFLKLRGNSLGHILEKIKAQTLFLEIMFFFLSLLTLKEFIKNEMKKIKKYSSFEDLKKSIRQSRNYQKSLKCHENFEKVLKEIVDSKDSKKVHNP